MRHCLALYLCAAMACPAAAEAVSEPEPGGIVQLAGRRGCVRDGVWRNCAKAHAIDPYGFNRLAVAPDGQNVYVASELAMSVAILRRDAGGGLTQPSGAAGCVSERGVGGCARGRGLATGSSDAPGPDDITVSPDGRSVYVATSGVGNWSVATFARDPATGALHQLPGPAGCAAGRARDGCALARGLAPRDRRTVGAAKVTLSPDGRFVYVAAAGIAVFSRDLASGALTQLAGAAGCLGPTRLGCAAVPGGLGPNPEQLLVTPDGRNAYVMDGSALLLMRRDPDTGGLNLLPGRDGCIVPDEFPSPACTVDSAMSPGSVLGVTPAGTTLYLLAGALPPFVTGFHRDTATGQLTRLAGASGCVGGRGCQPSDFDFPTGLAVSPDGRNLYVFQPGQLLAFSIDASGGLQTASPPLGCARTSGDPCTRARGLRSQEGSDVAVSPDGRNVYAAGSGVAAFARLGS